MNITINATIPRALLAVLPERMRLAHQEANRKKAERVQARIEQTLLAIMGVTDVHD